MRTVDLAFLVAGATIAYFAFYPKKKSYPELIIDLKPAPSIIEKPAPISEPPSPIEFFEMEPEDLAPHEQNGFGFDIKRNVDSHELDDYLNLPLVGTGKTYSNSHMSDLDELSITPVPKYKYIRLTVVETREHTENVHVGHIYFYNGSERVKDINVNIWNPHTGEKKLYTGSWSDNTTRSIVFCFTTNINLTRYDIQTSSRLRMYDPNIWTLEGSKNASYWVPIDTRYVDLPDKRGKWSTFRIK
jgi:hypothetical protein